MRAGGSEHAEMDRHPNLWQIALEAHSNANSEPTLDERLSNRTAEVMQLAQEEGRSLNHPYIGTEHILLALIKDGTVTARILNGFGINQRNIREPV